MTELEQEAIEFMKKQPKAPEGHLVYKVMADFTAHKLKQLTAAPVTPVSQPPWYEITLRHMFSEEWDKEFREQQEFTTYMGWLSHKLEGMGSSVAPVSQPEPQWRLVNGIEIRWDEEAKVFVGKKTIYSQSTTEETAIEAVKSAIRLLAETKWATQPTPKGEETKYLKLLRWFKLFYDFYQKDVAGKPSACASALAEDGELQEFIREANRIG